MNTIQGSGWRRGLFWMLALLVALMFKRSVMWLSALFLLALVSRPLFIAVHSRIARPEQGTPAKSATGINPKEKRAKEHEPNNDYGKLPIYFERNVGQTDSEVKFMARGTRVTTFLTATEAVFSLPIGDLRLPIEEPGSDDPVISRLNLGLRTAHWGPFDSGSLRRDFHKVQSPIGNRQSGMAMRLVGTNANAQIE